MNLLYRIANPNCQLFVGDSLTNFKNNESLRLLLYIDKDFNVYKMDCVISGTFDLNTTINNFHPQLFYLKMPNNILKPQDGNEMYLVDDKMGTLTVDNAKQMSFFGVYEYLEMPDFKFRCIHLKNSSDIIDGGEQSVRLTFSTSNEDILNQIKYEDLGA